MTMLAKMVIAAALAASAFGPAAAQYPYPNPYPQPYPQQPYQGYPQQGYPQQGYPQQTYPYGGNVMDQVIGGLLGNNYNANDQQAVTQCASAAIAQAQSQYGAYNGYGGYNGYGYQQQPYPYGQNIRAPMMRVTAITQVERRSFGLRVRGLIDSGYYGQQNYQNYQYPQNQGYAHGDLKFRCNVDYRGYVSSLKVERNEEYHPY